MAVIIAIFTSVAIVLGVATAAGAQSPRAGGVLDVLSDVLDLTRTARGHVVEHRAGTLVLRGEDERIYRINTAGLDAAATARLREGRFVSVALKSASPGAMPIAASVEAIEIQPSAAVGATHRLHGAVEAVGLATLTLRADNGHVVTVDTTQVTEPVRVRPGDLVTIVGTTAEGHSERFVADAIQTDTVGTPTAIPPTGR
jgi:hypothetical protein